MANVVFEEAIAEAYALLEFFEAETSNAARDLEERAEKYYVKARVYGAIANRFRNALESIAGSGSPSQAFVAKEARAEVEDLRRLQQERLDRIRDGAMADIERGR